VRRAEVSDVLTGLLRACHPLPTVAVTVFAAALGAGAGLSPERTGLLALAVLTGQLSIGWSNDAVDAGRDRAVRRIAKPVVAGLVTGRTVWWAAGLAAAATVPLSLALGPLPGVLHIVAVAAGWVYNLGVKATVASPLPYLVCFGLLPAVAGTAAGGTPSPLIPVAGALLGVAAHFANTVPDAADDARTGVRGLPQRIGPRASRLVAGVAVVLAAGVLLVGGASRLPVPAAGVLAAGALLGLLGATLPGRWSFRLVVAAAALVVLGVVGAGPALLAAVP
jgi:4-hydroxybenzoate polyprenyltransferase